jgi:intracellular sulfur oxidation DsrE/DsrF family protein
MALSGATLIRSAPHDGLAGEAHAPQDVAVSQLAERPLRAYELEVEIVRYHDGLHMLRDDTSPVKEEIKQTRAKVPQVTFGACNNTKRGMERREGKTLPIIAEAHIVPAGIVRIVELQEEGYKYVKP